MSALPAGERASYIPAAPVGARTVKERNTTMDDITRERVWRKLQVLPDGQLFQVLDFIEFLEGKYAAGQASEPSGIQRFAERLQDRLRGRSVAPEYITGAVSMLGMARRALETGRDVVSGVVQTGLGVVDEVVEAGKGMLAEATPPAPHPGEATLPAGVEVVDGTPVLPHAEAAPAAPARADDVVAPAEPASAPPAAPPGRDAAGEDGAVP